MTERHSLDDVAALEAIDSEDVLGAVEAMADQCRVAWETGVAASGLPEGDGVENIVILGMGGSGVSGDVTAAVLEPRLPLPLRVVKSYGPLPEWVGRNSLVFAVSYSGSTEETLGAFDDAYAKGARLVAISSGGPLRERAQEKGTAHIAIPPGLQPRASLGFLTLPILAALQMVGLAAGLDEDVDETVAVLEDLHKRCDRSVSVTDNPAKDLAHRLYGKIAVIYGSLGLTDVAAMRFKCDINEYGKVPAFWAFFPELNHNEIVGWTGLGDVTRENMSIVMLRDADEHPRVALRYEITERLIADSVSEVIHIDSCGTSALARLFSLVYVTQLAAIYMGLQRGVDPGPVEIIQRLKGELAER